MPITTPPAQPIEAALWSVRIRGGGCVLVPASTEFLTTYVLLEQEDWFEKEIGFARIALQPGMTAVDVGANHGVYTVALARAVGAHGAVVAFEPATSTVAALRRTVAANGFGHVAVYASALSSEPGTGYLSGHADPELNALVAAGEGLETVPLTTLDAEFARRAIRSVDFLKLDAEGAELAIVRGGQRFLAAESPLVMFERAHGTTINSGLPDAFRALGYGIFRLVGPDRMLVPVTAHDSIDSFELNLFACKPDRAAALEARGLLAAGTPSRAAAVPGTGLTLLAQQRFATAWSAAAGRAAPDYECALDQFALWRDAAREPALRYWALGAALAGLRAVATATGATAHLSSLARCALEAGQRVLAVQTMYALIERAQRSGILAAQPCWPAWPAYDAVAVTDPGEWLAAAAVEGYLRSMAFSGCFADGRSLALVDWLQGSQYASARMERWRQLKGLAVGRQRGVTLEPWLARPGPEHLNAALWRQSLAAS